MKIISSLIAILAFSLLLWGFFHFKKGQKVLVYENTDQSATNIVKDEGMENDKINTEMDEMESITEPVAPNNPIEKKDIGDEVVEKKVEIEMAKEKESTDSLKIKDALVSWGFASSKGRKIDTVVLHSSYNALGGDKYDLDKLIAEYQEYGVAPHYVIDREGNIFRLVKDSNIAYHAGESQVPDGRNGVNTFSLGIELINTMEDKYTASQYQAVNDLIVFLKNKYEIKYVLGHNQIAPGRKTDPWNINWSKINK